MKTFGLFLILEFICVIFFSITLGNCESFSSGEKFIIGMLIGWFCYKLIKEE